MKISKRQLKRIVKEEKRKLQEVGGTATKDARAGPGSRYSGLGGGEGTEWEQIASYIVQQFRKDMSLMDGSESDTRTWKGEKQFAEDLLYDRLIDEGALDQIVETWAEIMDELVNGEFHPDAGGGPGGHP